MCAFTAIACITFFYLINKSFWSSSVLRHPLGGFHFPKPSYMSIWYLFRRYKMAGWKNQFQKKNEQYITTVARPDTINKLFFIFLCIYHKYNHWVFVSAIANSYRFEFVYTLFSLLIVPGCTTGDAYCIFIFSGALIFWLAVIYRLYEPLYFPFPLPFWILVYQIFLLWNNLHHSFLSHF